MKLTDETYNHLKWIAMYLLPSLGTLYFALASIWGFPYVEQIIGTISAIDTFLGVILGISKGYYEGDGTLQIDTNNSNKDIYRLDFNVPPEELKSKKAINLIVDINADFSREKQRV